MESKLIEAVELVAHSNSKTLAVEVSDGRIIVVTVLDCMDSKSFARLDEIAARVGDALKALGVKFTSRFTGVQVGRTAERYQVTFTAA